MTRPATARPAPRRGIMLLEVLFALTLLASAGAIVFSAFRWSSRSVAALRTQADACDLAVSVMSQLEAGLLELKTDGPYPADPPHLDWTWQTIVEDLPGLDETEPDMLRVEVVVVHVENGYTWRLIQWLAPPAELPADTGAAEVEP